MVINTASNVVLFSTNDINDSFSISLAAYFCTHQILGYCFKEALLLLSCCVKSVQNLTLDVAQTAVFIGAKS